LTISETMRRNARLYHVPTLFLIDPENFRDHDAAYARGARDLVPVNADLSEISGRILELANYHRIHDQLKLSFGSLGGPECMDEETGLFNTDFFTAHMKRVFQDCKDREQDLTLLAVKPVVHNAQTVDPIYLRSGIAKIGGMLKSLIRMHDVIARYDDGSFIMAFPGASETVVDGILERISGLIDCAAFETGNVDAPSFSFDLDSSMLNFDDVSNSQSLMEQVISQLHQQPDKHIARSLSA